MQGLKREQCQCLYILCLTKMKTKEFNDQIESNTNDFETDCGSLIDI